MDFELTATQRAFRDRAHGFAQDRLLPGYRDRERAGRIEPALRKEIGGLGLIAPESPVGLGGQGADRVTSGVVTEEIGRADLPVAYLQVVGSLVGQILATAADPRIGRWWVSRICAGDEVVGIALTEPHAGSDAGMPRMTAAPDGDGWVLDGTKSLSFAMDAAAAVVFARTGPSAERGRGISAFLVPLDGPGVRREAVPDMGTRAVARGLVHLERVREAAMCKWWAPKTAHDVVTQCLLLHGRYGYRTDLPIEQRMRDVLGLQIGDGTAQIMKLVIARQVLGRELAP